MYMLRQIICRKCWGVDLVLTWSSYWGQGSGVRDQGPPAKGCRCTGFEKAKARTKVTAGPSTAQVAKYATCFAQDDRLLWCIDERSAHFQWLYLLLQAPGPPAFLRPGNSNHLKFLACTGKEPERRINEVHHFPCLKIETWATHHLWSNLGHPPSLVTHGTGATRPSFVVRLGPPSEGAVAFRPLNAHPAIKAALAAGSCFELPARRPGPEGLIDAMRPYSGA